MKIYGAGSLEEIKKSTALGAVGILTNPQGFEQYFEMMRHLWYKPWLTHFRSS